MVIDFYPRFNIDFSNINIVFSETGYAFADIEWNPQYIDPFNRLYFVSSGIGYLCINEKITELRPGNVYLIPAGCAAKYKCNDHMEHLYHHFNIYSIVGKDYFSIVPECLSMPYNTSEIFELIEAVKKSDYVNLLSYKSLIMQIISDFAEIASKEYGITFQTEYSEKAYKLFNFINNNLNAHLRVKDCANYMNLSIPALTSFFKDQMGESLGKYIDTLLMQKILNLILTKEWTIKELSSYLNFSDQYYFSRFFKKHMGIPPSRYRNEYNLFRYSSR